MDSPVSDAERASTWPWAHG